MSARCNKRFWLCGVNIKYGEVCKGKATKKGFLYAKNNQKEAINIFEKFLPEDEAIDLRKSLKVSAKYFGTELEWGIMDSDVVEKFLKWLRTEGLELQEFGVHDIISNELLQLKF